MSLDSETRIAIAIDGYLALNEDERTEFRQRVGLINARPLRRSDVWHMCETCAHVGIGQPCDRGRSRGYRDCYELAGGERR